MTELAMESPLEAITVRAIAARAGVGYATFFRHYPDKDALLADVADRLIREFLQRVAPLMQEHDRGAAARSMCDFVMEHLAIYTSLLAGGSGETVRAEMLRQTLVTMTAARGRAPESPFEELVLFHMVSSILNLLTWWLRNLDRIDAATVAEVMERTILTPISTFRTHPPAGMAGPPN